MTVKAEVLWPGKQPSCNNGSPSETVYLDGLVKAAAKIAQRRREVLLRLKLCIKAGDKEKTFELASDLCGIEDYEQESHRTAESIH